jgi:DNA-binding CsgD family transcriptional regulator
MFDLSAQTAQAAMGAPTAPSHNEPKPYRGPERRAAMAGARHWLAATLDELDYGVMLLHADAKVLHVNHAARNELDEQHPLRLDGAQLGVRRGQDAVALKDALYGAAQRGLRKLLTLGDGAQRVSLSVVPLASPGGDGEPVVLVILAKRQVCEVLSVQGFARSHGLSATETRVLSSLCHGTPPTEIAEQGGVAISTVRSHIGNIRIKTGATSIRALVRQVAVLPPLMGVLRGASRCAAAWNDSRLIGA